MSNDAAPGGRPGAVRAILQPPVHGATLPASIGRLSGQRNGVPEASVLDGLSRMPNRQAFFRDLSRGTAGRNTLVLVTLADARIFDGMRAALGHVLADNFVRAGAHRLARIVGTGTPIYHVSTLAFAFRLPGSCAPSAPPLIRRIVEGFREPLRLDGIPIETRLGIGLRVSGGPGASPAEDLRAALSAAQQSHAGKTGWAWYDLESDEAHRRTFQILTNLTAALEAESQLELHYQPKICLATRTCDSVEALVRWTHPVLGPVSPAEFVPLAEATVLVTPLTRWVIDAATRQIVEWRRKGLHMRVAINISPRNLEESDFVEYLVFNCAARAIDHAALELEVTEGVSAGEGSLITDRVAALRALGFHIAIDDFGAGFSNMAYLTRLSANTLKIDRSLVSGLAAGAQNGRLVAGIVQMGHDLGYKIVAEGVETERELDLLADWGCDVGQGWHFGRPMSADRFFDWHRGAWDEQPPAAARR